MSAQLKKKHKKKQGQEVDAVDTREEGQLEDLNTGNVNVVNADILYVYIWKAKLNPKT